LAVLFAVEPLGGDGSHPLANFSFGSALTDGATPQGRKLLDALSWQGGIRQPAP
jgi:hypothetical protein